MLKKVILLALTAWLLVYTSTQGQSDLVVVLETTPTSGFIGPDETLTQTTLRVVDRDGQPIPNAYLKLHLDAPSGNAFVSTDFPIVEDTPLFEYEGALPEGVLAFNFIYPIRGTYRFQVEAGRNAATPVFADTLTLTLAENTNEIMNFAVLAALLLGLGIVAGFIIGRGANARRMAMTGLSVCLSLGLISGFTALVQAHGGDNVSDTEPFTEQSTQGDLSLAYTMTPGAGRVGTLNQLNFTVADQTGNLVPDTIFDISFWHVEDNKPVFATTLAAPEGETTFEFQFFDGAEHEVRVTAHNAAGSVDLNKVVQVEGLSPPLSVKIKTTFYLVLIVLVG
ncbi:MAG TPA: hypothetical protein VGD99_08310, partial [Anaerolineae bacterium]